MISNPIGRSDCTNYLTVRNRISPVDPGRVTDLPDLMLGPICQLDGKLSVTALRDHVRTTLGAAPLRSPVPTGFERQRHLVRLSRTLTRVRFPTDRIRLRTTHHQLIFSRFFCLRVTLLIHQNRMPRRIRGRNLSLSLLGQFGAGLPFTLAKTRRHALARILSSRTLNCNLGRRLLQIKKIPRCDNRNRLYRGRFGASPTNR